MTGEGAGNRDHLVLVHAPTGRDTPLTCALLSERGMHCEPCIDMHDLCVKVRRGAGCVVLAEESLDDAATHDLIDTLADQLPWSDLPVIVLTNTQATNARSIAALRERGNVTVLDRPVRILTMVSAVQSALRARRRQYEVRDLLMETRDAVRQRDQFLAMLGHELRNPLATVTNAMTVIDATRPPDDENEAEQRDVIRRQNEHLARLVDDLLDVSRITSGKILLQRRPLDLGEVARRAAKSVQLSALAQEHEFVVRAPSPPQKPIVVNADPVRLEQVVNNLLTNAIKYTPRGGRIELTVTAGESPDTAELRVCDNGIGMSAELLSRVFELFAQGDPALDRSQGGLGIGLTLVRALIEMHGGQVTARSGGPGCGSEFVITLPRCEAALSTRIAPASDPIESKAVGAPVPMQVAKTSSIGEAKDGRRRRVLVVEDQTDARRVLQRLLQIWGFDVDTAENGLQGVDLAIRQPPDVALVDVGLPGLDGYEVARRIRSTLGDRVHLVALTGYGQPEDRERAYDAGFDLHLIKPVDRDQLAHALTCAAKGQKTGAATSLQAPGLNHASHARCH